MVVLCASWLLFSAPLIWSYIPETPILKRRSKYRYRPNECGSLLLGNSVPAIPLFLSCSSHPHEFCPGFPSVSSYFPAVPQSSTSKQFMHPSELDMPPRLPFGTRSRTLEEIYCARISKPPFNLVPSLCPPYHYSSATNCPLGVLLGYLCSMGPLEHMNLGNLWPTKSLNTLNPFMNLLECGTSFHSALINGCKRTCL